MREYGGFLPLELNAGNEWFADYEQNLMRFNSVKASLSFVIRKFDIKNIYVPYYYCPSTIEALRAERIQIHFYHISEKLLPLNVCDMRDAAILVVNYFGILDNEIKEFTDSYKNARIVIDNAHAFFCLPIMKKNVYNVYSAKKFFGIPDGSYVIAEKLIPEKQTLSYANDNAFYLLTSYEYGTDAAYREKKEVDRRIAEKYDTMSVLARALLQNVDYSYVRHCRKENFRRYLEAFSKVNLLQICDAVPAYHFPLLLSDNGKMIKQSLVKEKIYVPTLWQGDDLFRAGNEHELYLAENTIFLPVDQRYDKNDIDYIIDKVDFYIHEHTGYYD